MSVNRKALKLSLTDRSAPGMGASLLLQRGRHSTLLSPRSHTTIRRTEPGLPTTLPSLGAKAIASHPREASTPLPGHLAKFSKNSGHPSQPITFTCSLLFILVCLCQRQNTQSPNPPCANVKARDRHVCEFLSLYQNVWSQLLQ